mmetsp:Transcript_55216/g.176952  ORF Transcript_55216/g.176952 Transcript_55216/m.176952 type:complete len:327 (+) Transcript_55216:724-1704(+)
MPRPLQAWTLLRTLSAARMSHMPPSPAVDCEPEDCHWTTGGRARWPAAAECAGRWPTDSSTARPPCQDSGRPRMRPRLQGSRWPWACHCSSASKPRDGSQPRGSLGPSASSHSSHSSPLPQRSQSSAPPRGPLQGHRPSGLRAARNFQPSALPQPHAGLPRPPPFSSRSQPPKTRPPCSAQPGPGLQNWSGGAGPQPLPLQALSLPLPSGLERHLPLQLLLLTEPLPLVQTSAFHLWSALGTKAWCMYTGTSGLPLPGIWNSLDGSKHTDIPSAASSSNMPRGSGMLGRWFSARSQSARQRRPTCPRCAASIRPRMPTCVRWLSLR